MKTFRQRPSIASLLKTIREPSTKKKINELIDYMIAHPDIVLVDAFTAIITPPDLEWIITDNDLKVLSDICITSDFAIERSNRTGVMKIKSHNDIDELFSGMRDIFQISTEILKNDFKAIVDFDTIKLIDSEFEDNDTLSLNRFLSTAKIYDHQDIFQNCLLQKKKVIISRNHRKKIDKTIEIYCSEKYLMASLSVEEGKKLISIDFDDLISHITYEIMLESV